MLGQLLSFYSSPFRLLIRSRLITHEMKLGMLRHMKSKSITDSSLFFKFSSSEAEAFIIYLIFSVVEYSRLEICLMNCYLWHLLILGKCSPIQPRFGYGQRSGEHQAECLDSTDVIRHSDGFAFVRKSSSSPVLELHTLESSPLGLPRKQLALFPQFDQDQTCRPKLAGGKTSLLSC